MHISENWIQLELDDLIRFIIGVKSIHWYKIQVNITCWYVFDKYDYQNS